MMINMRKSINLHRILNTITIIGLVFILIKSCGSTAINSSDEFRAFYVPIDGSVSDNAVSNETEEADIVVELGEENGRLVFLRSENYLPYWETKYKKKYFDNEISGNLRGFNLNQSAKIIICSTASIAKNSDNKSVIKLKHQTKNSTINNRNSEYNTEFIDEYFIVYNNGAIERRILKRNISPGSNGVPTDLIVKYFMLTKVSIKKKARKVNNKNILTSLLSGNTFLKTSNPERKSIIICEYR